MQTKSLIQKYFIFCYVFSLIVAVSGALLLQYHFHIKPCELCLYERYIFYATIPMLTFSPSGIKMPLLFMAVIASLALSGYHSLIELKVIEPIVDCVVPNDLNDIFNKMPDCREVNFRILGLSLANVNFIYHSLVLFFGIYLTKKQ